MQLGQLVDDRFALMADPPVARLREVDMVYCRRGGLQRTQSEWWVLSEEFYGQLNRRVASLPAADFLPDLKTRIELSVLNVEAHNAMMMGTYADTKPESVG